MIKVRAARNGSVRVAHELRNRRLRKRPWLVLIQGLGFDRSGWDPVAAALGRRFGLVLVDNRGVGASDVPAAPSTVADMAGDVAAVLDAAGIGTAHVLGTSLGGMVAQELAIEHPERVRRLVLVCTSPGFPLAYPPPLPTLRLMSQIGRLPRDIALRRHVENALAASTVRQRPELVDRLVAHQQARPPDRAGWLMQASAGARYAGHGRQARIRAATLVLQGTADTVVDPRNARVLADHIPDARLATFPDGGHLLFWEQPDRFVEVVSAFLQEDGSGRLSGPRRRYGPAARLRGRRRGRTASSSGWLLPALRPPAAAGPR
jgi:3-oxoadipate enol-lactonase